MKIYQDMNLSEFEFWSGAVYTRNLFSEEELEQLESALECEYPDGMTDVQLNSLFWFEPEWLCELLGIDYENDFLKRESQDSCFERKVKNETERFESKSDSATETGVFM